jgi:hypothetical protein
MCIAGRRGGGMRRLDATHLWIPPVIERPFDECDVPGNQGNVEFLYRGITWYIGRNNSEEYDSTFTKLLTLTNLKALLPFGVSYNRIADSVATARNWIPSPSVGFPPSGQVATAMTDTPANRLPGNANGTKSLAHFKGKSFHIYSSTKLSVVAELTMSP